MFVFSRSAFKDEYIVSDNLGYAVAVDSVVTGRRTHVAKDHITHNTVVIVVIVIILVVVIIIIIVIIIIYYRHGQSTVSQLGLCRTI